MTKVHARGRRGLNRNDLLEGAFAMVAAEGEAAFSLRKLAAHLGVDPMTLLHYFGSKEGLLREIADYCVKTVDVPAPSDDWKHDLRTVAAAYRDLARRHPLVFPLHFRFHATGARDHAASEVVHRAMRRAGLPDDVAAGQSLAFFAFVLGFALAETEGLMQPLSSSEEQELGSLDPEAFAATHAFIPAFKALNSEAVFAAAIDSLILGLADYAAAAQRQDAP